MISNQELVEEIEDIGLAQLLEQDDGRLLFEDETTQGLWADAVEAVQRLAQHLDLDNQRRQ